jgi:hypothetical protein
MLMDEIEKKINKEEYKKITIKIMITKFDITIKCQCMKLKKTTNQI